MDSNKINEYLQYLKENNQQDSISDYFTKYIPSESISEANLFTFKTPELKVNDLFKTSNPIINNKDYNTPKKTLIRPPKTNTPINSSTNTPINSSTNPVSTTKLNNKDQTGKYIRDYFVNKGLTKEQSSAIAGNLFKESSFNSNAVGDTHLPTYSEGLAQWREGRLTNLKNFANSKNKSYKDLNTQLDFLWNELNTSEKEALNYLKNSKNISEASKNFASKFERMAKYTKDREDHSNYFYKL